MRIKASTLRRWRDDDRRMGGPDRAGPYLGKVGEVTNKPATVPQYPRVVWVRFKHEYTGFDRDWLEKVR